MAADKWVTFDCYGTLVDWNSGIRQAMEVAAPGHGLELLAAYHEIEPAVEAERPFRPYRDVLDETMRRAAAQSGIILVPGSDHRLADSLPEWPVFPDVTQALTQLHDSGWKLGILSNVDRDLIAGTLTHIPVPFDVVVTAQDVHAYKPALDHFRHFESLTHAPSDRWIHVAQSWFHDVIPAHGLGLRCVWINRNDEKHDSHLDAARLRDLRDLPATLRGLQSNTARD